MSRPIPNATKQSEDFEFAALSEARNYRRFISEEFAPYLRGDVLEVGCGIGQMTEAFQALPGIGSLTCVEPDPCFVEEHRSRVKGVSLIQGTVADVPEGFNVDAIVSINVLEHIEDDQAELARYRALLAARSGRLCLLVPARPELYAAIDADFGHFRRYTKTDLEMKLRKAGMRVDSLFYFNWVGYFAWLVNFRLLGSRSFDVKQVRVHDKIVSPIVHWMESRIARPPFGQSLIAISTVQES